MKPLVPHRYLTTPALTKRLALLMAGLAPSTYAADIVKANNGDGLLATTSWVQNVLPTAQDVAVFDSSLDANLFVNVDGSLALKGIKVVGNQNGITLDTFGSGLGTAAIFTLGGSGLDMSGASSGSTFTFDSPTIRLERGVRQPWSVADGATAVFRGPLSSNGGAINFNFTAANTGVFSGLGFTQVASKMLPFAATVTKADGTMNFAALDASKNVVSAETLGTAVSNPAETTAGTAVALTAFPDGSYVDVAVSNANAGATAFAVNASIFTASAAGSSAGLRFSQPHSTAATNWTISFGSSGRFQPSNPVKILVTPGVGARDVIFANGGGAHEFRFNNAAGQLIFEQFNTLGTVYWRGDTSSAAATGTTGAVSFMKTGPGKLVWANAGFGAPANTIVSITDGLLQMGENNATGSFGSLAISNSGTLRLQRSDAFAFANVLSGTGNLEVAMSGTGNVTVSGNNTYTGSTKLESGTLTLGSATALGATSSINLAGGTLAYGAGVATDLSVAPITLAGTTSVNTGSNNVTWANSIGGSGSGGLTKTGVGALTLGGANSYSGSTAVNGGELIVTNLSGSATGSGNVSLAAGSVLRGTGTISGSVTTSVGAKVAPGVGGVGTLTTGGLSLAASSLLDLDFSSTSSYDNTVVTGSNGLTINGGGLTLLDASNGTPWKTPGTYNLFQFNGAVQGAGASALSVLNPQAGYAYTFSASGSFVTLQIELDAILTQWTSTGAGSWGSGSNWSNGVPASGYTAQFTTALGAPATVTLDGSRTVNGMVFTSANGYTIAPGTGGTLTLDKGVKNAAVNITLGDHVISAPIALNSTMAVGADANSSLSLTGVVSGSGGVVKTGNGTLNLNGHNTFTGAVNATAGTLGFAFADSLGSGTLTLNGATLKYGTGNTADISSKTITFGQDGATIDTNGNDIIWLNAVGNGGIGSLTKTGAGILSLAAANNYSGNTTVKAGSLQIDANDRLGALGSSLVFDGGTLATSGNFTLQGTASDNSTVARPVQVNAGNGTINVAANSTLTVTGTLSGTGNLAKDGAGVLAISSTGSNLTKTGGATLKAGTLHFTSTAASNTTDAIGAGTITLEGGTITSAMGVNNTLGIGNAFDIPAGKTASIVTPNRFAMSGAVTGGGTLNMSINTNVTRADISNTWTGFTGTLNLTGTGGVRLLNNGGGFNTASFGNSTLNAGAGLSLVIATNSGGNTIPVGALSGGATLTNSNGGAPTWQIGALNTNTTFSGNFTQGNSHNHLSKVGTGALTLTGSTLQNGLTTVNAGSLLIDGVVPASVATAPTAPARFVTVATTGTIGGSGTITPDTVVNGGLRTDSTGNKGGQLTFGGVLELLSTATTQFDFNGANFTGVKSTSATASSVTYNGLLKFNFLGTVFDGSYKVFDIAATPAGAFTGVSVTTTTATETALGNSGTVWSGTVGSQSYSFDASTGILSVTGGATAVTPGASVLSAIAGNGKVDLSWTAASGADTYTVKRATVQGGPYTNLASGLSGTTYSDTGLTNGTTYYYVVQAKNATSNLSGANSNEVSAVPALPYTALQSWRFEQFGVYTDTADVLAGDTEDYDSDGLANLLEYALGTDPKVANASPVTVAKSGNFLTLTYPRRSPVDAALTYAVQGSNDLGTAFAAGTGGTVTTGSTSVYTDNVDVSATGARRFLRLSVSYTAP